ncbi:hypothetical protein ACOSP7_014302 [Xanthoceras sorbifolium]
MRKLGPILLKRCKNVKWNNAGCYNINTDIAIDELNCRTSIKVIISDCRGLVMASCAQSLDSCFFPSIVKAMAILRGLRLAIDTSFVLALIESDAKSVVNLILSSFVPLSEIGIVTNEILSLLYLNLGFSLKSS